MQALGLRVGILFVRNARKELKVSVDVKKNEKTLQRKMV